MFLGVEVAVEYSLITLVVEMDNREDPVEVVDVDHQVLQEIQVLEVEYLDKEIQEELEQLVTALMITDRAVEEEEQVKPEDNREDLYQKLHKAE